MDVSPYRCTQAKTKVLSQLLFTYYQKEMTLMLPEILPKSGHWDITHLILWKDRLGQATPFEARREPKGSPRLKPCPKKKPFTPELLLTDHPVYPCPKTVLWMRLHSLLTKLLQSAQVSKTFGLYLYEAANCPLLVERRASGHHALCYLLLYI